MTPISKLLAELWLLHPSFIIVFDKTSRKTCIMEGDSTITEEDHVDSAIYKAWLKYYKDNKNNE